ncbi:hypothetical protein [Paraburkholderia sp. J8-2]|uniref:hypothetical protein n=1 Tax=Paraburkholderia sp. J8-2 TaxID=2805440 RepID=UPI002AB64186|nr:hypothetical protein [Paraburkholderia sp. J8-2]
MNFVPFLSGAVTIAGGSMMTMLVNRFLERRRLEYGAEGMTVIEKRDSLDGLSVTHNGESIERLTKSRIWLWNSGRKAILPADVYAANPLKATFPGARILDLSVLESSDGALGFKPKNLGDGSWQIDFDHWDGNHGVLLEALHTSTRFVPKLTGSVKGLNPIHSVGRIELGSFLSKRSRTFRRWTPLFAILLFAAGVWAIIELNLRFDIGSFVGLLLLAPGEVMLILCASYWLNAFSIPRGLRRLGGSLKGEADSSSG